MAARHFVLGHRDQFSGRPTACGVDAQGRMLQWSTDAGRVTCLRCRRWLARHGTADDLAAIGRATWEAWKHDD